MIEMVNLFQDGLPVYAAVNTKWLAKKRWGH